MKRAQTKLLERFLAGDEVDPLFLSEAYREGGVVSTCAWGRLTISDGNVTHQFNTYGNITIDNSPLLKAAAERALDNATCEV